ncbi:hypothetical protein [Marinococcus luteus]|uniref:hypothetical protein n=1 Tax=Marinococcus luteus TaxID=1122204 RepID=UPI002ACC9B9B|nr:hypothetical protein [Marinococcus luteus]MDZ5782002.1 hypothetical protein [Marinococcus luteus]
MNVRQIILLASLIISITVIMGMNYFEKENLFTMIPLAMVAVIGSGWLTADVIKNKRLQKN